MKFKTAIVRIPGEDSGRGETTSGLGIPDLNTLLVQHRAYIEVLKRLGLTVVLLDPLPGYPDAYFVEDTAVIIPEAGIITNPGAVSRKGEEDSIELIMTKFKSTRRILEPGSLDGGDVLQADRHFFIGLSERTNQEGADQLRSILQSFGYTTGIVEEGKGLHLKSGVNYLGDRTLIITADLEGLPQFSDFKKIVVKEGEEYAANTLHVNGTIITPEGFPYTYDHLVKLGKPVISLNMSEVRKMDGGLTCMSLRF